MLLRQLFENIEDQQADLYAEFEELAALHHKHPDFPFYKEQFNRGMKDFSAGYEADDDDLIDNGIEGMQQAVEALSSL